LLNCPSTGEPGSAPSNELESASRAAAVALAYLSYVKIKTTEKLPCYEEAFLAVAVRLEQNQQSIKASCEKFLAVIDSDITCVWQPLAKLVALMTDGKLYNLLVTFARLHE
jgi:hypothetical protein